MLGVDGLNLAMMIADSGLIDTAVNELMDNIQLLIAVENRGMNTSVQNHLLKWRGQVKKKMTNVCETERFQQELALYQEVIHWDEKTFFQKIPQVLQQLEWHSAFYTTARQLCEQKKNFSNPMFPRYFCDQWYNSLSNALKQAQVMELEANKDKVLDDLYQRIETLRSMDQVTDTDDVQSIHRLWNMASAKLGKVDLAVMKKHAEFLKKHKEIQQIAESLGRMASEVDDPDLQQASVETLQLVEEQSDLATDDIVGVHQSDDLNKILPNEMLFLAHPELEVIFYKHLIDKRLLNYRMQGKSRTLSKVTTSKPANAQVNIEKGPFVVCIDASGSMNGFPEQCAKAVAYALMQIALADNRDCYVVIFSTQIITYQLTKQDGLREVCDFLSYTFRGGTDLELALSDAINTMHSDRYKNADLVVISDFMAPKPSQKLNEAINTLKAKHNRFHAISLSRYGNPQLMEIFDYTWRYYPGIMGRLIKSRSSVR
ncbi:ATPase RavA stimulator ViaA [Vibrio sp. MEBiC08052]|uniref:ATPase RavA stimulator ViaA n=1 Tax=Vibrio sp. MEBiC08052 TaxID=1761910 RepID=UPI0007407C3C|nr:ATPase RavA stimulator ViaA [Vibrio sp. MEBiC08052]KUI98141.1 vWA domain protein [Vibrio sp. MEBiC08052]